MEQDIRDSFTELKDLILRENKHQNKAFEEYKIQQQNSFDEFKVNHDKVADKYWRTVLSNKKTLDGNGNPDGGLVAKSVGHDKDIGINRRLVILAITLMVGTAVILVRTGIAKTIFGG